jgi:hypothetical protein
MIGSALVYFMMTDQRNTALVRNFLKVIYAATVLGWFIVNLWIMVLFKTFDVEPKWTDWIFALGFAAILSIAIFIVPALVVEIFKKYYTIERKKK